MASLRSPWMPVAGSRPSAVQERRRVLRQPGDQRPRLRRRQAVERIPTGQEAIADGEALRAVALGRRAGEQEQALAQRAPRPAPIRGRRAVVRPGHRMQAGDRLDDVVERRRADDRVLARPVPGDELVGQVGHQHRDRRAVAPGAQVGRDERLREAQPGPGDEPLAQADVARRTHDPVRLGRGPLEDEPRVTAIERGQRRTRPAVVRERDFGDAGQPVLFEELSERPRRSGPQHGAGTSSAPSGPPSR